MKMLQPASWPRPKGYANGISARGRTIFTAGVIGWDGQEKIVAPDLPGQLRQILRNILAIIAEDGAGPEHVVRMTWYVVDLDDYRARIAEVGAVWREVMGRNFPAMAVVEVKGLVEPAARLEIEAVAMVPD
ncbi:MAG: RidA family protein [Alphaproteobacteria bacterium]|nr:RidA family protein [Alphaproteobacteria bacterium]